MREKRKKVTPQEMRPVCCRKMRRSGKSHLSRLFCRR
jgi:hypothetical protein